MAKRLGRLSGLALAALVAFPPPAHADAVAGLYAGHERALVTVGSRFVPGNPLGIGIDRARSGDELLVKRNYETPPAAIARLKLQ